MHEGHFSQVFERFVSLDPHLPHSNLTRLRVYTLYCYSRLALGQTRGDYLTAGVSAGTAPLTLANCHGASLFGRHWYLLDPLTGVRSAQEQGIVDGYSTNFSAIAESWPNEGARAVHIPEYLTASALSRCKSLAFVHLNTGDFGAESSVLPDLLSRLETGGFLVMDSFGHVSSNDQTTVLDIVAQSQAECFQSVTRQLIIFQPVSRV